MDNSIKLLIERLTQLKEQVIVFRERLDYSVIKGPQNELSDAVRKGFPEDKAMDYFNRYLQKNDAFTEKILNDIDNDFVPYLKDVVFDLQEALNLDSGSAFSASTIQDVFNAPLDDANTSVLETNYKDLEKALGIKRGPKMSIAEADKQNANPHLTEKYIEDPKGSYVDPITGVRYRPNPQYDPNDKDLYEQYNINCATCATAYALRLMGFDVKAKGNVIDSGSLNERISNANEYLNVWKNIDGTKVEPVHTDDWMKKHGISEMTVNDYRKYFEETCKDQGVYVVMVRWFGDTTGHATILQRDSDGVLYYIEPQRYERSKGVDGRRSLDDLLMRHNGSQRLSPKPSHGYGVLRVDDKVFNTDYVDLFETK